jgi:hypothetical protein
VSGSVQGGLFSHLRHSIAVNNGSKYGISNIEDLRELKVLLESDIGT